jgi:hypothetical protein
MAIDRLTTNEKRKLKAHLMDYGNTKKCAKETGIDASTLRRVKDSGRALEENIIKLRAYIVTHIINKEQSQTA